MKITAVVREAKEARGAVVEQLKLPRQRASPVALHLVKALNQ